MKFIKSISTSIFTLLLCTACESDLEQVTYSSENAIPSTLSSLNDNIYWNQKMLPKRHSPYLEPSGFRLSSKRYQFVWKWMLKTKNFANKVILASSKTDVSHTITVSDLNSKIMALLKVYEMETAPIGIEFRISSSISAAADTLYSNIVSTTITPYEGEPEYPAITLRGSYNGWDFTKSQKVYSVNSDNIYAAMVYFDGKAADGWKFCGTEDWSTDNWGAPESMTPEQSPVTLVSGNGGDIKAYSKNSYYLEFNNTTGELKVSKPHNSWGIVGDHNSWGSGDTMMTLETETDENNKFQYYLKATLDMSAGNKWKIRPEEKWE